MRVRAKTMPCPKTGANIFHAQLVTTFAHMFYNQKDGCLLKVWPLNSTRFQEVIQVINFDKIQKDILNVPTCKVVSPLEILVNNLFFVKS